MKIITILLLISAICYNIQAQTVPNGDFEFGSDTLSLNDWHSINEITGIFFPFTRTTDSYSGEYAVKLQTLEIFSTKVPGVVTLGNLSIGDVQGSIYFPYKPDKLIGMYKHPTDKDASQIRVYFLKKQGDKVDTIAQEVFIPEGNVNEYQAFEIEITYNSPSIPDSMNIILISDLEVSNSTFFIDNLEFVYNTNAVTKPLESKIDVYPNPADSYLYINPKDLSNRKYLILNLFGEVLISGIIEENNLIDISTHPSGIYFLVVGSERIKIIKN